MPGRGAYVSLEPEEVQQAWDKKILDRVLETTLTDEFYQELLDYVTHQKARKVIWKMNTVNRQKAMNLIGLAMRAGKTNHG